MNKEQETKIKEESTVHEAQCTILVTGGTGLVGSHLLYELTSLGYHVRALRRTASNVENVRQVFSYYTDQVDALLSKIEWIEGDILDILSLHEALQGIEYVYHTAAFVSFDPKDKKRILFNNIKGTEHVVNACLEKGVKKLCHVSSIAALGSAEEGVLVKESISWVPSRKRSVYSQSKFYSENEVWRGIAEGLNAVIVNPSVIIGPGDWNRSSAALFSTIKKGLPYYTPGSTGYVYVCDVVKIMISLMNSEISGERFILNAENLSIKEVFTMIAQSINVTPPKKEAPRWLAELAWRLILAKYYITRSVPTITKETVNAGFGKTLYSNEMIKMALNYKFTPIEESIKRVGALLK